MRKLFTLFFFILNLLNAEGQTSVVVSPDHFLPDKRGGVAPTPLFLPGKDQSFLPKGYKHPKLKLPKSNGQTGFTFMSCNFSNPGFAFEGRTLLYFTAIGTKEEAVYVDRNSNYDYTDDGAPVQADSLNVITVTFISPKDSSVKFIAQFSSLASKMDMSKFPVELFASNPYYDGLELINEKYWKASDVFWIKSVNTVCDGDSMTVVFLDANLDGYFAGKRDKIGITDYGIDSAWTDKYHSMRNIVPDLILPHHGKAYEIVPDTIGRKSVTIKSRNDLKTPVFLMPGDQLPHFKLKIVNGDSVDIYSILQPGKFTYIDFWGIWCAGCVLSIPKLQELNAEKSDSLVIVSIDAYDEQEKLEKFIVEKKMTWVNGQSNSYIENLLYAGDGFPFGILIDPEGKIVEFDVSVRKVKYYMDEKK